MDWWRKTLPPQHHHPYRSILILPTGRICTTIKSFLKDDSGVTVLREISYWQLISPCKILITYYPQVFHYPIPTTPSPQPTHTGERVVDRSHYILETVKGEWLALIFENNQRKNSHTSSYPVSTLKMCLEIFPRRHERPIIKERVLFISVVGFLMSVPQWNLRRHLRFQL